MSREMLIDGALAFNATSQQYGDETMDVVTGGADYVILRGSVSNYPYRCYIPAEETTDTLRIVPDSAWAGVEITSVEEQFICIPNPEDFAYSDIQRGNLVFNLRGLPETIIGQFADGRIILGYNEIRPYIINPDDIGEYENYIKLSIREPQDAIQHPLISMEPAITVNGDTINFATPITYNMLKSGVISIIGYNLYEDTSSESHYLEIQNAIGATIGFIDYFEGIRTQIIVQDLTQDIDVIYTFSDYVIMDRLSFRDNTGVQYAEGETIFDSSEDRIETLFTQDGKNAIAGEVNADTIMSLPFSGDLTYTTKLSAKPIPEDFNGIICRVYITADANEKAKAYTQNYDVDANYVLSFMQRTGSAFTEADFGQPSPVYLQEV